MKHYIYTLFALLLLLSTSCSDEDTIIPTEMESVSRFVFPEGTSECDRIFNDIYEEYGIQILYKNWTEKDWTKSWTNPTGGSTYVLAGRHFVKGEVDSVLVVAEFMRDNIFAHVGPELFQAHKPYIYLVSSFSEAQDFGAIILGAYKLYNTTTGLDFEVYSPHAVATNPSFQYNAAFTQLFDENNEIPKHKARVRLIYHKTFIPALDKKKLVAPKDITSNMDFNTELELEDATKSNYYAKRGFVKIVNSTFETENNPKKDPKAYDVDNIKGENAVFRAYLRLAMYKTKEEVTAQYGEFPLVMEKYNLTVSYMKEQYDVDLQAMAEKY